MYKSLLFLLMTLIAPVCAVAEEENQEIRVHLTTSSPLQPVYIGKVRSQEGAFDASYTAQIEAVLTYDMNYSGMAKVSARTPEKEQQLLASDPAIAFHPTTWKKWGFS